MTAVCARRMTASCAKIRSATGAMNGRTRQFGIGSRYVTTAQTRVTESSGVIAAAPLPSRSLEAQSPASVRAW